MIKKNYSRMYHILIVIGTIFHCKQAILIFFSKFSQKGGFLSQPGAVNIIIKFDVFQLVWVWTLFDLKQTVKIFWTKFTQKKVFSVKIHTKRTSQANSENLNQSRHQFLPSKSNSATLGPNLPIKGISHPKQRKWRLPPNSGYLNYTRYQLSFFAWKQCFCSKAGQHITIKSRKLSISLDQVPSSTKVHSFWTKLAQNRYFHSKTDKTSITLSIFSIFKLTKANSSRLSLI